MQIGIVPDLRCNARGLIRALDIIGDADELLCLGGSICDFGSSNEVVRPVRQRGARVILGRHGEVFCVPGVGIAARYGNDYDFAPGLVVASSPSPC